MKYYAVKVGKNPGIYDTWDKCKEEVSGYNGALYKSFNNYEDALNYIEGVSASVKTDLIEVYVDGSYDINTRNYSFGGVVIDNGKVMEFKKAFPKDDYSQYRNVSGEVRGASYIINYLYKKGIKEFNLYYDYAGIEKWYTFEWKANNDLTKKYQEFAKEMKDKIKVNFIKVKSHTNNKYNDMADLLAKQALGIK